MAIILKETPSIEPLEQGMYDAILVQIYDLGMQSGKFGDKQELALVFEIVGETVTVNDEEQPRRLIERRNVSFNQKAKLRKNLESWRGKKFTSDELKGFDLKNLIGLNALLNIVNNESEGGKVYSNIEAINPPMKKAYKKHKPTMDCFIFDFDTSEENYKNFEKVDDYFKGLIKESPDFKALMDSGKLSISDVSDAATTDSNDDDEDIPF